MRNALVLIDIQKGFSDSSYWGKRNNADFEIHTRRLLEYYRKNNLEVIHVQHLSTEEHSPLRSGQAGVEFVEGFQPRFGERIFQKSVNSAFIGTNLETYLSSQKIESLTLAGLTSDHCVSTSARMGANLGFRIFIISECVATFDRKISNSNFPAEQVQLVHLASLNDEFAKVINTVDEFEKFIRTEVM